METITESDEGKVIDIIDGKNSISLRLNIDNTKVNLTINNISIGEFKMENGKLNIFNTVLKWYGNQISPNLQKEKKFFENWDMLRGDALRELGDKFIDWNISQRRLDFSGSIAVGLTFGYSTVLKNILKRIICDNIQNIRGLRIILIRSSEAPGDEEMLKAELLADYRDQGLKCDILPIEAIEKKEIQFKIRSIFVGIESINKQGDIVHPRGGSEIIRKIKKHNENISVYAFGESYKVQDFREDIDFTKLSLFRHENIDYVVTDHGVHEKIEEKYLFSWNEIPGNDNERLIEFLKKNFDKIDWIKTAKIEKIDGGKTIKVSTEKNSILLTPNEEKTNINLKIDDGRTEEIIAKIENGKLNIYGEKWKIESYARNNLSCCSKHWEDILRNNNLI